MNALERSLHQTHISDEAAASSSVSTERRVAVIAPAMGRDGYTLADDQNSNNVYYHPANLSADVMNRLRREEQNGHVPKLLVCRLPPPRIISEEARNLVRKNQRKVEQSSELGLEKYQMLQISKIQLQTLKIAEERATKFEKNITNEDREARDTSVSGIKEKLHRLLNGHNISDNIFIWQGHEQNEIFDLLDETYAARLRYPMQEKSDAFRQTQQVFDALLEPFGMCFEMRYRGLPGYEGAKGNKVYSPWLKAVQAEHAFYQEPNFTTWSKFVHSWKDEYKASVGLAEATSSSDCAWVGKSAFKMFCQERENTHFYAALLETFQLKPLTDEQRAAYINDLLEAERAEKLHESKLSASGKASGKKIKKKGKGKARDVTRHVSVEPPDQTEQKALTGVTEAGDEFNSDLRHMSGSSFEELASTHIEEYLDLIGSVSQAIGKNLLVKDPKTHRIVTEIDQRIEGALLEFSKGEGDQRKVDQMRRFVSEAQANEFREPVILFMPRLSSKWETALNNMFNEEKRQKNNHVEMYIVKNLKDLHTLLSEGALADSLFATAFQNTRRSYQVRA